MNTPRSHHNNNQSAGGPPLPLLVPRMVTAAATTGNSPLNAAVEEGGASSDVRERSGSGLHGSFSDHQTAIGAAATSGTVENSASSSGVLFVGGDEQQIKAAAAAAAASTPRSGTAATVSNNSPPVAVSSPPPPPVAPASSQSPTGASAVSSPITASNRYYALAVQYGMKVLSASKNLKQRVSPVWALLLAIATAWIFAPLIPSPPNMVLNILVFVLFFLVGLSLPLREWWSSVVAVAESPSNGARNNSSHGAATQQTIVAIACVFVAHFVVAPTVTAFLFWVLSSAGAIRGGSSRGTVLLGCAIASSLPPSPSAAAALAGTVGVSPAAENLAFIVSTVASTVGLFIVPFVSQLSFSLTKQQTDVPAAETSSADAVHFREATELLTFLLIITLLPLFFGAVLQAVAEHVCRGQQHQLHRQDDDPAAVVMVVGDEQQQQQQQQKLQPSTPTKTSTFFESIASLSIPIADQKQQQHQQFSAASRTGGAVLICPDASAGGGSSHHHHNHNSGGMLSGRTSVTGISRKAVGVASFALRFLLFVLLFQQQGGKDTAPTSELWRTMLLGLLVAVVSAAVSWFVLSNLATSTFCTAHHQQQQQLSSSSSSSPSATAVSEHTEKEARVNTRIALWSTMSQKSDMLLAPVILQLLSAPAPQPHHHHQQAHRVRVMLDAFAFCLAQLVVSTAVAATLLRQWQRKQLCAPGAAMLPQKFSRASLPAHYGELAAAAAAGSGSGSGVASPLGPTASGGVAGVQSSSAAPSSSLHFGLSPSLAGTFGRVIGKGVRRKSEASKA